MVDAEQLEICAEVIKFKLRTYAAHENIAEAVKNVTSFHQSSAVTVQVYNKHICDSALRCRTLYFDGRLKSVFVEGQIPANYGLERN